MKLDLEPRKIMVRPLEIEQSATVEGFVECASRRRVRMKHTIVVINHSVTEKVAIKVSYETDIPTCVICDAGNLAPCAGGDRKRVRILYARQTYWKERHIVTFLCYHETVEYPVFNLEIRGEVNPDDMPGEFSLIMFGDSKEEDGDKDG